MATVNEKIKNALTLYTDKLKTLIITPLNNLAEKTKYLSVDSNGQTNFSTAVAVSSMFTADGVNTTGAFTVNNTNISRIYEAKINRGNTGVYYKDGYTCHIHAWWKDATDVFFPITSPYRPKTDYVTCVGFCYRKDNDSAYPMMCELLTDGTWQVWAMTSIGTNGGGSVWKMYDSTTDHRSEFVVCVTGSWLTDSNGL